MKQILLGNDEDAEKIMVHVTGAVKNEGIVTLDENSRLADAINAAGGLTDDADMNKINLAYVLEDGSKIKIPSVNDKNEQSESEEESISTNDASFVESITESSTNSESKSSGSSLVNINKASQTELEALPGIGPSIALKIVTYRDENGKFSKIEDLMQVSGIGEKKFESIKDLICVK